MTTHWVYAAHHDYFACANVEEPEGLNITVVTQSVLDRSDPLFDLREDSGQKLRRHEDFPLDLHALIYLYIDLLARDVS